MLKDVKWPDNGVFQPNSKHEPIEFFKNALCNSTHFDLELGYFSSAAISVLSDGFATFIAKGGNMRLVINQIVSKKDKESIELGLSDSPLKPFDLSDIDSLKETLNDYDTHFFNCLAYLIRHHRILIKIIKPIGTKGIAHSKTGLFDDGESILSFNGSANFTLGGLFNNREKIQIAFADTPDEMLAKSISDQRDEFENIMNEWFPMVEYLDSTSLEVAIASTFGGEDIDELVDVERKLQEIREQQDNTRNVEQNGLLNLKPHFPFPQGPRKYQINAYEEWLRSEKRGFFAMATGTGKTLTALNCLLNEYKDKGTYKCIILVPTISLVEQWRQECLKFSFNDIFCISSKFDWQNNIIRLQNRCRFNSKDTNFIIISTYASVAKTKVQELLFDLPKSTLVIADEAHNMGSPTLIPFLKYAPYKKRIGLSATPDRQYDDIGNTAIEEYFNCRESYTFSFTMKEAIEQGYLCKYRYFPHVVKLTAKEMEDYAELSTSIAKYYCSDSESFKDDPILEALLLKRKRIIHKAFNKIGAFQDIIKSTFQNNGTLKYTLVYVPEGAFNSENSLNDYVRQDDWDEMQLSEDDDLPLIRIYSSIVRSIDEKVTIEQFTSREIDRNQILRRFETGQTHVLVSMKCLDEGVDVPRAELAIFCASTGNPRQFIQRRGRVLRVHKEKPLAIIHDLVVVPEVNPETSTYQMERSLVKRELERVFDFASLSTNRSYTQNELQETMNYYQLNLSNND